MLVISELIRRRKVERHLCQRFNFQVFLIEAFDPEQLTQSQQGFSVLLKDASAASLAAGGLT